MKKSAWSLQKFWTSNKDEIFVLDIFSCGLRAAYLKNVGGRYELQDWSVVYNPDVLKSPDLDIGNFILMFSEKNSIKTKEIILSLSDLAGVVIKETLVQSLGGADDVGATGSAIKFQLAEEINFDPNLAQVGWRHLSDTKGEQGERQSRVLALIIDRELINRFVGVI